MLRVLKRPISNFLKWHVVNPILRQERELLFQNLVSRDLASLGVQNNFYPIGAAASYGLLYLPMRILQENAIDSIVEFGSGESTRLIDAIKRPRTYHVCYEDNPSWHGSVGTRLGSCDYRLRALRDRTVEGRACSWYDAVEPVDFDLMLVDGPSGVEHFSRLGCWETISSNSKRDFVVVFDDFVRQGERETLALVTRELAARGLGIHVQYLESGNVPAVVCCGRYAHVRFYV